MEPSPIEEIFLKTFQSNSSPKLISHFYNAFMSFNTNATLDIKARWEAETGTQISEDTWEEVFGEAHLVTNSGLWREFKWKVVMRYFRTPEIIAKMKPTNPDTCWRNCGTSLGTHSHIFWSCPKICSLWNDIFKVLSTVFQQPLTKDQQLAILGVLPKGFAGNNKTYLLRILQQH